MTLFWLVGAALAALVLALLLRPLARAGRDATLSRAAVNLSVYRDQLRELEADLAAGTLAREDYDKARAELEARMLDDVGAPEAERPATPGRRSALAVGLAVPLLGLVLYLAVGDPGAMRRAEVPGMSAEQVQAVVERLAEKLRERPDDPEGWKLLGRAYSVMGRFPEAAHALGQAALRAPNDAQLLVDFADVLAMTRGQRLEGEPEKLVLRALEIDPNNLKALALAGTAAFERSDFAAAAGYWERMLPHVPVGSEEARANTKTVSSGAAFAFSSGASVIVPRSAPRKARRCRSRSRAPGSATCRSASRSTTPWR